MIDQQIAEQIITILQNEGICGLEKPENSELKIAAERAMKKEGGYFITEEESNILSHYSRAQRIEQAIKIILGNNPIKGIHLITTQQIKNKATKSPITPNERRLLTAYEKYSANLQQQKADDEENSDVTSKTIFIQQFTKAINVAGIIIVKNDNWEKELTSLLENQKECELKRNYSSVINDYVKEIYQTHYKNDQSYNNFYINNETEASILNAILAKNSKKTYCREFFNIFFDASKEEEWTDQNLLASLLSSKNVANEYYKPLGQERIEEGQDAKSMLTVFRKIFLNQYPQSDEGIYSGLIDPFQGKIKTKPFLIFKKEVLKAIFKFRYDLLWNSILYSILLFNTSILYLISQQFYVIGFMIFHILCIINAIFKTIIKNNYNKMNVAKIIFANILNIKIIHDLTNVSYMKILRFGSKKILNSLYLSVGIITIFEILIKILSISIKDFFDQFINKKRRYNIISYYKMYKNTKLLYAIKIDEGIIKAKIDSTIQQLQETLDDLPKSEIGKIIEVIEKIMNNLNPEENQINLLSERDKIEYPNLKEQIKKIFPEINREIFAI